MSSSDLLNLILAARQGAADVIPPGFKNCDQWAEEWNLSPRRAQELLMEGTRNGITERKMFRVVHNDKSLRPRPYFRALKKG